MISVKTLLTVVILSSLHIVCQSVTFHQIILDAVREMEEAVEDREIFNLGYSPDPSNCTVGDYLFTFLYDGSEFKVHGLWPNSCTQCTTCSWPSCCDASDLVYTDPIDPRNFVQNNWYHSTAHDACSMYYNITLFEHEFYNHGSCMGVKNTTQYLDYVETLYDDYYDDYVKDKCDGHEQLWLHLDTKFNVIDVECK